MKGQGRATGSTSKKLYSHHGQLTLIHMNRAGTGYILAIDQGTTGSTVLVFDHDAAVCGRAYSEFPQHYPQPGWVEHDANEIWSTTIRVIGEALQDARIDADQLRAIGITNQRETCLLWDRTTGNPVANAIVWQDRRTTPLCDTLRNEGLEPIWKEKTGLRLDPYFSATKLRWLLDQLPTSPPPDLAFGTIDTWLVWNLTKGARHVTDVSNASRTLLFNLHDLHWDQDILDRLRIPSTLLPTIVPSSGMVGETHPDVFFGQRIPIAGIAGDQQAALFGQTCYREGDVKNTYGTGCFLLMNTGSRPVLSQQHLLSTVAWKIGNQPAAYALEGSVFVAGVAVQWLRDGLELFDHAADSKALAMSLTSNEDVYFVPALTGLGAPHWDPHARGTIVGLTRGTTKAHLARAALESMAYQTREVVNAMTNDAGITLTTLRADGGRRGQPISHAISSRSTGRTRRYPLHPRNHSPWRSLLAGLGIGFWESQDELRVKRKVAIVTNRL